MNKYFFLNADYARRISDENNSLIKKINKIEEEILMAARKGEYQIRVNFINMNNFIIEYFKSKGFEVIEEKNDKAILSELMLYNDNSYIISWEG